VYVFSERLCRLMCGDGYASPKTTFQKFRGYALAAEVAAKGFREKLLGKTQPFRTSSGKAAKQYTLIKYD
jgi:hypothetical protein